MQIYDPKKLPRVDLNNEDIAYVQNRFWGAYTGITFMAPIFIANLIITKLGWLIIIALMIDYFIGPVSIYRKYIPKFKSKYLFHGAIAASGFILFAIDSSVEIPTNLLNVLLGVYLVLLGVSIVTWAKLNLSYHWAIFDQYEINGT